MQPTTQYDATAEFYERLNDPQKWVIKQGVPVFKAHERVDPASGKQIKVDDTKLERIAKNMQLLEAQQGVPIRMTLGHTEPGKPETNQPPIAGYYRNPRVQTFGPKGEKAVVVDEWLDPQYRSVRKNYPYRSAEYYDDTEQITGVALLTRDPFLDLGVVAYSRGDQHHATYYDRSSAFFAYTSDTPSLVRYQRDAHGRVPVMYRLTLGETPMNPTVAPMPQPGYGPAPLPQVPTGFPQPVVGMMPQPSYYQPQAGAMPQPAYTPPPVAPNPAMYGSPAVPTPYWDGTQGRFSNSPTGVPHQHANTGAIYGRYGRQPGFRQGPRRYADEEQQGMPPGPGEGGPPGGGGMPPGIGAPPPNPAAGAQPEVMQELFQCLSAAVQILSQAMGGGGMGAPGAPMPPSGPFPSGGGMGGPPTMASRVPRSAPRGYYADPRVPTPYTGQAPAAYPTTISGLPVGYQMAIDKVNYENRQIKEAMKVLLYERDQADTQACAAEIGKLAAQGFSVGEYEVQELKRKRPEERPAFLQHIVTHYQQIGTQQLPPVLGDPTPAAVPTRGPATQAEVEQALRLASTDPSPTAYRRALEYVMSGAAQQGLQYQAAQQPSMADQGFRDPYAGA